MTTVYYSLAPDADGTRERQWATSVRSLRQHNRSVPVVLCLYGEPSRALAGAAREAAADIEPMGEYAAELGDIPPHWRTALSANPTLHKLLSLPRVAAAGRGPVIYLDCDTYLFGDIAGLPGRYPGLGFCAREEPLRVCDRTLSAVVRGEGLAAVRPYNTGVMLFSARLATTLASLAEDFVWYAWRLLTGACLWSPELVGDAALVEFVRSRAGPGERRLALPYPAPSIWIIEEVATWLTLGRVPGLAHAALHREDAAQGGECTRESGGTAILAHYFTTGESRFFGRPG